MILLSRVFAIDPGVHASGYAYLGEGDSRVMALYNDNTEVCRALENWCYEDDSETTVILELPRVYSAAHSKGSPEDLIQLARTVGRFEQYALSLGAKVVIVRPRDWKGTVKKEVFCRRILEYADSRGIAYCLAPLPASRAHNAIDALGLWLHARELKPLRGQLGAVPAG